MLNQWFDNQLVFGLAQAGAAALMALVLVALARRQDIHLGRETVIALIRGLVQIVAVGSIQGLIL
jgi:putative ABC transport system permease protein